MKKRSMSKERLGGELGVAIRWRAVSLLITFVAIVGFALPALGDDWRPFRGHGEERILTEPEETANECLNNCLTAFGAGWATHLGHFTRMSCGAPGENGHVVGTTEFTAANGDTLCAAFDAEPPEGNIVSGKYTVIGGTGRFSDASGEADFVGVITFDDSGNVHIAVDFLGTIQY